MMDFLSQKQLDTYENTIDKIQHEHAKTEKLRQEIERVNNMLVLSNLSQLQLTQKLGHINVKIFSNLFDLYSLYQTELKADLTCLFKQENCKFYLVEVLVTNALLQKLKHVDWSLILKITHSNGASTSRSLKMLDYELPILEVFAIDSSLVECQVTASISTNDSSLIPLDDTTIDISYHFENAHKKSKIVTLDRKILEVTQAHNPQLNLSALKKPLLVEYSFYSKKDKHNFIKLFIQHCYHKLDLELFSELGSDSNNSALVKFSTGAAKSSVTFNKESQMVTLRGSLSDMVDLKGYFWNEDSFEIRDVDRLRAHLKELLSKLNNCTTRDELCNFYLAVRTIWTK